MSEKLLVVDENDKFVRFEDKIKCHEKDGILHRAFLILLFNENGELLLTKRADNKLTWPGFWDGSVASHVHKGEKYGESAVRRVPEELVTYVEGITMLGKITYFAKYNEEFSEREICGILTGFIKETDISPIEEEISEYRFVTLKQFKEEIKEDDSVFCPWLLYAFAKFSKEIAKNSKV